MTDDQLIQLFDGVKYVYLREISEPDPQAFNTLAIVADEAVVNHHKTATLRPELSFLKTLLKDAHNIEPMEGCRTFRLYWKNYISYMVTEEMAHSTSPNVDAEECYVGKLFQKYSKSPFLEFIERNTGGRICEAQHYRLICLDHIIDIASCYPPEIEVAQLRDVER